MTDARDISAHARIIDHQFTLQAEPFATFAIHTQEESLVFLRDGLRLAGVGRVLDVGCGPGLVANYLAAVASAVVGVDATQAMVDKATARAREANLTNVSFQRGLMEALPFADASFDAVVTRYTFHHVLVPKAALAEMVRVSRPGGRVVVCDATPRADRRAAYDAWERVRDPSHSSAYTPEELRALAEAALDEVDVRTFRVPSVVDELIASSFPAPGGAERLRREMVADVGVDALDMNARWEEGTLMMSFPITVIAGTRR